MNEFPKVINILAGPCAGKSTVAGQAFVTLKINGLNAELTNETAKWYTYEENFRMMPNQLKLFAEQQNQIFRLIGKVDYIIMDSPLILSAIYDVEQSKELRDLVLYEYNKLNNLNYFIVRETEYKEEGRYHNLEQAIEIDNMILNFMDSHNIKYKKVTLQNVIATIIEDLNLDATTTFH